MTRTTSTLRHTLARASAARALAAGGGAVALAIVLAACAGSDHDTASMSSAPSASPESGASSASAPMRSSAVTPDAAAVASASAAVAAEHNDFDIAFAQQMIVHHQGAVQMAELAEDRAQDPAVHDLASRVEAAQTPEIAEMTGWLQAWGAQPSESGSGDTGSTDHDSAGSPESAASTSTAGSMDMDSTGMGQEDTAALEQASGSDFDQLFLRQMTVHHQGAVDMATSQRSSGVNPQAIELAGTIVTTQTAEISEMDQLRQSLLG